MSEGPRRPVDPQEDQDLDASAYSATVPSRLEGFRGTNPIAFVIAGVVAIGIILLAGLAFFHRGPTPDNSRLAAQQAQQQAGPAAPGLGGQLQTPFIPAATAVPYLRTTPAPLIVLPAPFTPVPQRAPVTPIPVQEPVQRATVPPPVQAEVASDEMKINQPGSPAPGAGASSSGTQPEGKIDYVPVYRDGKLVSVVAVAETPSPQASNSSASPQQSGAAEGSDSSQFVANGSQTGSLGAGNAGLLEARKFARDSEVAPNGYVRPKTLRQLTTATVLNARLMSKIESDLPGPVIAQITQPVYDSNTHTTVVVPAGTRVFGKYDEETVASSTRLLMSFTHLIFPDGEEFDMGGQPATDSIGTSGLAGDVDRHPGTLYTSALLLTVLGAAEAAVTPQSNSLLNGQSVPEQAQSAAGAQLNQLGNKLLNNAIERPATIIVRPPFAFQIIVTRDLALDSYASQHQ